MTRLDRTLKSALKNEKQMASYLDQKKASRENLKPQESSPDHHRTEAKFLLNKKVQATTSKKLAERESKSK